MNKFHKLPAYSPPDLFFINLKIHFLLVQTGEVEPGAQHLNKVELPEPASGTKVV
jgi:hypothetical protein